MGKFKVIKITDLENIAVDEEVPESDYSIITEKKFIQMKYLKDTEEKRRADIVVRPGLFHIQKDMLGLFLESTSFSKSEIIEDLTDTKEIESAVDCFISNIHTVYKEEFPTEVPRRAALLYGPAGCHAKGQGILMYNGSIKKVEDIIVGDKLMGPDSKPREVLKLARGQQEMVRITPVKGNPFVVNMDHILHLTPTNTYDSVPCAINITVREYVNSTKCFQERFKITRCGVDFPVNADLKIDPYILGAWLGDGSSHEMALTSMDSEIIDYWSAFGEKYGLNVMINEKEKTDAVTVKLSSGKFKKGSNVLTNIFRSEGLLKNKHIPSQYLTSSRDNRLKLLAGLIDTDGTAERRIKTELGNGFSYSTKLERLANDIVFLCRSLGYAAYKKLENKTCTNSINGPVTGQYYRISISGNLSEVPVKLKRKKCGERSQIKSVLRTGFSYELLPIDDYYGFSLDKDHLYLTDDFTIHHNTGKSSGIHLVCNKYVADGTTAVIVWHTSKFEAYEVKDFAETFKYEGVEKLILVVEDLGGIEAEDTRMNSDSSLLALLDNNERTFTVPTFILATTNFAVSFLANIANRPGRFEDKIEVGYPSSENRKRLLTFFSKGTADQAALDYIASDACKELSTAHIKECYMRSRLRSTTILEASKKVVKDHVQYTKGFRAGGGSIGLFGRDDD